MATSNSETFQYSDLAWDRVAELPRTTPLVLPLGSIFDPQALAHQLGDPPKIGILPAFPFGWRGSGIQLPEEVFVPYILNLLDSLRDDGFASVYCLSPSGVDPQSNNLRMASIAFLRSANKIHSKLEVLIPPDEERGKVILIPIGHTEQHGYHLPLSVDTIIVDAICKGTVDLLPTQ